MKRWIVSLCLGLAFVSALMLASVAPGRADDRDNDIDGRILQGFRIARANGISLELRGRNVALVGLGSYIVNAQGVCADCHSCPTYAPGHNPYGPPFGPPGGGDGKLNATNYLAGGVPFNPPGVASANLTPATKGGRPEQGNSFAEFEHLMRTGHESNGDILQVMPWPIYRNMTDRDLRAIYEFLAAIPPAQPGMCVAPGQ
jgi:hypothetical protein